MAIQKTFALGLLLLSNLACAAPTVMQLINGKQLELVSMTRISYSGSQGESDRYAAECPNGQARDAFVFRSIIAGRDTSFTVADHPRCNDLNFNTVGFKSGTGSSAKIALARGSGRPLFDFEISKNTVVDVSCARTVAKGTFWDDVTLTCIGLKNPRATFVFKVK